MVHRGHVPARELSDWLNPGHMPAYIDGGACREKGQIPSPLWTTQWAMTPSKKGVQTDRQRDDRIPPVCVPRYAWGEGDREEVRLESCALS